MARLRVLCAFWRTYHACLAPSRSLNRSPCISSVRWNSRVHRGVCALSHSVNRLLPSSGPIDALLAGEVDICRVRVGEEVRGGAFARQMYPRRGRLHCLASVHALGGEEGKGGVELRCSAEFLGTAGAARTVEATDGSTPTGLTARPDGTTLEGNRQSHWGERKWDPPQPREPPARAPGGPRARVARPRQDWSSD